MARKKIVFVIVEGPTDNDALGLVFEHFFKDKEVYVHIVHGDITTRTGINNANILKAVVEEIKGYASNMHLTSKDFQEIIHIVDMDGAFVDNTKVVEDITKEEVYYSETEIRTKDKLGIENRNMQKRENLNKMTVKNKVWNIPYSVYYMSCNLDHVLYNKLNSTDEEKEQDAFDFAKRFEEDLQGFLSFISTSDFSVQGTYVDTWKFIKEETHSLERHTNLGLCFSLK